MLAAVSSCAKDEEKTATKGTIQLTGDPWVPGAALIGASESNHDSSVSVTTQTLTASGSLVGLGQGWQGREVAVTFTLPDLGAYGSMTLVGETTGFPSAQLAGGAYAVLTSLVDPNGNQWINLARSNSGGDCAASGAFTCSSGSCSANPACKISGWPSAFVDRDHWEQRQIDYSFGGLASVNTFPTCNWSGGAVPSPTTDPVDAADRPCAFNTDFFSSGKLPTGSYTAKYVLMTDSYSSLTGYSAGLKVRVIQKTKAANANPGAFDVNLILVGASVSQASRNAQGKINLDTMMKSLQDYYSVTNVNVKLGTVRAIEWVDGEGFADVAMDDLGAMVSSAASVIPAETEGKAVNVFLVRTVSDYASLLGISGGIGGPPINGLPNSGVVVSTFGNLDRYNPGCTAAPCSLTQVDADFADLQLTLAHEIGHYLGLNHPSESDGAEHDLVRDTPICTAKNVSLNRITIGSCLNTDTNTHPITGLRCNQGCTAYNSATGTYCPTAVECEFNYMMYWSSKFFTEGAGTGDGNLFSAQQGAIVNYSPLVQ